MKLSNASNVLIDPTKLGDYLLNPEHERGKHKARVFAASCGITAEHVDLLVQALQEAATQGEVSLGRKDDFGQRYVIEWSVSGPAGTAKLLTAWIIRASEDFPRFVTCHIM